MARMMEQEHVTNEQLGAEVGIIKSRLDSLIVSVDRYIASNDARQKAIEAHIAERGRFHWPVLFGAVTAVAVLIGGAFTILKQQTDLSVALALAPVLAQNQVSITDRAEIRSSQSKNSDRISAMELAQLKQAERNVEQETQIHSLHTIANLDRAYQMAFVGALWKKSFGQALPYDSTDTQPRILPQ